MPVLISHHKELYASIGIKDTTADLMLCFIILRYIKSFSGTKQSNVKPDIRKGVSTF
jgi:hypothetical protein